MMFGRQRLDLVTMSGRELQRIEVLSEVLARRRSEISAAAILGLSTRQTRRLLAAYRDGGGGALIHKARGRTSNNRLIAGIREYVIELVRSRYADFGPSLAAEVLFEKDGVKVSRETLRRWMVEDGLWLLRKQRRSFHQLRLRRESTVCADISRPTGCPVAFYSDSRAMP
jgi:transposase